MRRPKGRVEARQCAHDERRREADEAKKRSYIEKYIPQVAIGLQQITEFSDVQRDDDVRNPGEVEGAPVDGARNVPLAKLRDALPTIDRGVPVVLLCAGGARSAIASSLLRAEGFVDVSDVLGGANALGVTAACSTQTKTTP